MQRLTLAALAGILLLHLGANCSGRPTRGECSSHPACRIVLDYDGDGDLADDFRQARNGVLYGPGGYQRNEIYFFPPPAGTYDWIGEVRFCGDDTPPTGQDEPDCDGTVAIPPIVFMERWQDVTLEARCVDPATAEPQEVSACLHFGDRMEGDGGAAEPLVEVETIFWLVFHHVETFGVEQWALELNHPVYAIWLDGAQNSAFGAKVGRDDPSLPLGIGSGAYVAARNSYVDIEIINVDDIALVNTIVLDGQMDGSIVDVLIDFADAAYGPTGPPTVGSFATGIGGGGSLYLRGPDDGCDYGPDAGGCQDFDLNLTLRTPANNGGSEALYVEDGSFRAHLDVEWLTAGHYLSTIKGGGTIDVTGSVVFRGLGELEVNKAPGFNVRSGTVNLDLPIQSTVWEDPICYVVSDGATVNEGPNYQCFGPSGP